MAARRRSSRAGRRIARGGATLAGGQVLVINMVPRSLSSETNQDSEPSITVNPARPREIVGTAFTGDPMGGPLAPVYLSSDGGNTWRLNSVVPSRAGSALGTGDISLAFGTTGHRLYGGILRDPSFNFETLRGPNAMAAMQTLASRPDNDQPFTHAISKSGRDRVYIGNNDFQAGPQTATVDITANGRVANPAFRSIRIEPRATAGQDGPQIRPVAHPDGTAYAAYYGWRAQSGSFPGNTLVVTTDVVVVRDDPAGLGANPFRSLVEPSDGLPGRLVARNIRIPFNRNGSSSTGQQRLGGTLSMAVDRRPGRSGTVYLAWADQAPGSILTIHVRCSTDRGVTWPAADLLTVLNATNAALAINSVGAIGLLYQQLTARARPDAGSRTSGCRPTARIGRTSCCAPLRQARPLRRSIPTSETTTIWWPWAGTSTGSSPPTTHRTRRISPTASSTSATPTSPLAGCWRWTVPRRWRRRSTRSSSK